MTDEEKAEVVAHSLVGERRCPRCKGWFVFEPSFRYPEVCGRCYEELVKEEVRRWAGL